MLPAKVAAESVDDSREPVHDVNHERYGLDIGRRQQAGLQPRPTEPERCHQLRQHRQWILDVRPGLQYLVAPPQNRVQAAQFACRGVRRWQRARSADLAVELVEKQSLRRHPEEPFVERVVQHRFHSGEFRRGRPDILARRPVEAHRRGAQIGVTDEGREVRAQVAAFELRHVFAGIGPRSRRIEVLDDIAPGDRFDAAEDVTGVNAVQVNGGQ